MRFIFQRVRPPEQSRRKTDWIRSASRHRNPSRSQFNARELRNLAALAKIPGRHEMNKLQLAEALDRHYAAARIFIAWRARRRRAVASTPINEALLFEIVNNRDAESNAVLDPITLEPVEEPIFIYQITPSKHVHYTLGTLLEYLVKGKVFKDPVTGLAYNDMHLREIDTLAHKYNLRAPSVLLLSRSTQPALQRQHQSLIAGLERIAGAYIEQFRQIVQMEGPFNNANQSAHYFNTRLHFEFLDSYRQLYRIDPESANISMTQWMQFLQGPPSRPTPDPVKFLAPLLRWMESIRRPPP